VKSRGLSWVRENCVESAQFETGGEQQMHSKGFVSLQFACTVAVISTLFFFSQAPASSQALGGYIQHNLVSDLQGAAITTDLRLKNPWGIAFSSSGPFWISDNATGVATVYTGQATPFPNSQTPLKVTVPPPTGSTATSAPTGIVFNGTKNFVVSSGGKSGPAVFIFATEDGTISGWNPNVNGGAAILKVDNSASGAVYKGLAMFTSNSGNFLYATDFHNNAVTMFDSNFNLVTSFTDTSLPAGFAPFGIANIHGLLYVTFAMQKAPENHDDQAGFGNGFVDVFSPGGGLIRQFAAGGPLNSPWGLAFASDFGAFSNALLVGNFGDGAINAFDFESGNFLGQLGDQRGLPLFIDGLWSLAFGNGGLGGNPNVLYFTAGPNGERDGLFGDLQPAQSNGGIVNP
jgi:uncharacterized protein (TIGR03118 family)